MKHYLPLNNAYEVIRFANYLQDKYYKVLKIDLEDMTYIPLKDDSDDIYSKESLVDWWMLFLKNYIHPDDSDICQAYIKNFKNRKSIAYRRKMTLDGEYEWCFAQKMMADGNCYLLMKKLDEDCIDTIASKEICERLAYYNMTFNCYNVNKYHQFIDEVGVKREYTLLYMKFLNIDKRNLKEGIVATNKKVKKGVELLNKFFGEDSVYNITGMGFLVYYEGDKNTLGSRLLKFHNALKECQLEILATYYNHPKDEPHLATLNKVRELLRVLDDKNNLRILKEKMVQREAEQRE